MNRDTQYLLAPFPAEHDPAGARFWIDYIYVPASEYEEYVGGPAEKPDQG